MNKLFKTILQALLIAFQIGVVVGEAEKNNQESLPRKNYNRRKVR